MASPDQGVIAGGISKVNTVHNYISLIMTDEMSVRGEMFACFLKTRTSSGKGKTVLLSFDANNLRISDSKKDPKSVIANMAQKAKLNRLKNKDSPVLKQVTEKINNLKKENVETPSTGPQKLVEMDGVTFDQETGEIVNYQPEIIEQNVNNTDDLLEFMKAI
jgi:hypothetical protein